MAGDGAVDIDLYADEFEDGGQVSFCKYLLKGELCLDIL